jgi:hypothetical protein
MGVFAPVVTTVRLAGGPVITYIGLFSRNLGPVTPMARWFRLFPSVLAFRRRLRSVLPFSSSLIENALRFSSGYSMLDERLLVSFAKGRCGAWKAASSPPSARRPIKASKAARVRDPSRFRRGLIGGSGGATDWAPPLLDRDRDPLRDRLRAPLSAFMCG